MNTDSPSNEDSVPDKDKLPDSSDPSESFSSIEDDAFFHTIFKNVDNVTPGNPDAEFESFFQAASQPLDEFELNVLTASMFSSVQPVGLPADFEQQVLDRINAFQSVEGPEPKSIKSSIVRQTSKELYSKYRSIIQIVFPLVAATGIVASMYLQESVKSQAGSSLALDTQTVMQHLDMTVPPAPVEVKKETRSGNGGHMNRSRIGKTQASKSDGIVTGY